MYDAENRRFASVDPVKGSVANPLTLVQYLYVVDSPLVWVDLLGKYYIKKVNNGQYYAVPESDTAAVLSVSAGTFIPGVGGVIGAAIEMYSSYDSVGGNSDGIFKTLGDLISDESKSYAIEKTIEQQLAELNKELSKSTGDLLYVLGGVKYWSDLQDKMKIPTMDAVCFKLFEMIGFEPKGKSINEVYYIMELAYTYVINCEWFFITPAYMKVQINSFGTPQMFPGPTVFQAVLNLKYKKDNGASSKEITEEINKYWNNYQCGSKCNTTLDNLIVYYYTEDYTTPYKTPQVTLHEDKYYRYALNNYELIWSGIINEFKAFMKNGMIYWDNFHNKTNRPIETKTGK